MKKVIELLEEARDKVVQAAIQFNEIASIRKLLDVALDDIVDTITILQTQPRWETLDQYEERKGKPWPDTWPVFFEYGENTNQYYVDKLENVKNERVLKTGRVCVFTEAGPPPDDWKPEEETR